MISSLAAVEVDIALAASVVDTVLAVADTVAADSLDWVALARVQVMEAVAVVALARVVDWVGIVATYDKSLFVFYSYDRILFVR